jgi:hypothetical protein
VEPGGDVVCSGHVFIVVGVSHALFAGHKGHCFKDVKPVCSVYVPKGHSTRLISELHTYAAGHNTQNVLVSDAVYPDPQKVQLEAPGMEIVLEGQSRHSSEPAVLAYLPAEHSLHAVAPSSEKVPLGHSEHAGVLVSVCMNLPASHLQPLKFVPPPLRENIGHA